MEVSDLRSVSYFFFNQTWKVSATISLNILLSLSVSSLFMGFQGSKYSDFFPTGAMHRYKKASVTKATNLQMSPIAVGSFKGYLLFGLQCFVFFFFFWQGSYSLSWILTADSQVWLAQFILLTLGLVIWQLALSVPWFSS